MFDDFGLVVGRYFTSLPTLANQELSELQLDSSGRLIIASRFIVGTDSFAAGDSGLSALAVRADSDGPLSGVDDGEYTPLQVDSNGRLKVNAQVNIDSLSDHEEDSAHSSGDVGEYVLAVRSDARPTNANTSTDGDYASFFVNANGELYVHDTDILAQLVTIDAVLDSIKVDTGSIDTTLTSIDSTLNDIDTALGNIEIDISNIDSTFTSIVKDEDSAHVSGDKGIQVLAVRNDSDAVLTDADGDYSPISVDSSGKVKIVGDVTIAAPKSEEYAVSDDLAVDADGLIDISAGGFVDVASVAVGAGDLAYLYGWQWAADGNAVARLVTEVDGADVVVYKTTLNSTAMPSYNEHWSESGRIEISGAADLVVKVQVKARGVGAAQAANASGSIHLRK